MSQAVTAEVARASHSTQTCASDGSPEQTSSNLLVVWRIGLAHQYRHPG